MVIVWSPPGEDGDLCAGVRNYSESRAPMTPEFMTANEVFVYGFLALGGACQVIWFLLRREPVLESRNHFLTFMTFVMIEVVIITMSRWATRAFRGPTGQTTMQCVVWI